MNSGYDAKRMLPQLARLAKALPQTWGKICGELMQEASTTEAERALLDRMTSIFKEHVDNVASMLGM